MKFSSQKWSGWAYYTQGKPPARPLRISGGGRWSLLTSKVAQTLCLNAHVYVKGASESDREHLLRALDFSRPAADFLGGSSTLETAGNSLSESGHPAFFGGWDFPETVGLWLESGVREGAALLSPFISTEGFTFTPTEFVDLRERLQTAIRRYERLPVVSNGLEDLNTGFFRHRDLEQSQEFITDHLARYLRIGDALHRDYLLAINRHDRAAIVAARSALTKRSQKWQRLAGAEQALATGGGRRDRKASRQLAQDWAAYLDDFPDSPSAAATGASLAEQLATEGEYLETARSGLHRQLKSAGLSLSYLTVNPDLGDAEALKGLAERLGELIRQIDEAGLYQLPLGNTDAATTPRQLQRLEGLLAKLRNTRNHLPELPVFYERRHFWYAQPAHLRRLLAPLLDLPTAEWETAFTSWYFEHCLERAGDPDRYFRPVAAAAPTDEQPMPPWQQRRRTHLVFLNDADPWPDTVGQQDLFVSLDGPAALPASARAAVLAFAPLHDAGATHVAMAGQRYPALVFLQQFHPLHPPAWQERLVTEAPGGVAGRVALQAEGEGPWEPLADWRGASANHFNIFLPAALTEADGEWLLNQWERLITTANSLTFYHQWSPDEITQGLLSDGFTPRFLCAALLRAAEAATVDPFDRAALTALGREVRLRCGLSTTSPHPLAEHFSSHLRPRLPEFFFELHTPWRDTFLPLVALSPVGKKTVLLPGGRLPGYADDAVESLRQQELQTAGFDILALDAGAVWRNWRKVVEDTVAAL